MELQRSAAVVWSKRLSLAAVVGVTTFFAVPFSTPPVPRVEKRALAPPTLAEVEAPTAMSEDVPAAPRDLRRTVAFYAPAPPPIFHTLVLPFDEPRVEPELSPPCETSNRMYRALHDRQPLLDDPELESTRQLLFLLGSNAEALGHYDQAASYYESFARHHRDSDESLCTPTELASDTCPSAPRALRRAFELRRSLGQRAQATENAAAFVANYGETRLQEAAEVGLEAAELAPEAARLAALQHHHRRFGRHSAPETQLRLQLALGKAQAAAGNATTARRTFRGTIRFWESEAGIDLATRPNQRSQGRQGVYQDSLAVVAEAGFELAEMRFRAFRGLAAPRYDGPADAASINRFVATELGPFLRRKLRFLSRAEVAYEEVAALGVTEFRVAANARRGQMYAALARAVRDLPTLEVQSPHPEETTGIEVDTGAELSSAAARLQGPAVESYRRCLDHAVQSRRFGAWSRLCAEALEELDPEAYPPAREIHRQRLHHSKTNAGPRPRTARPEHCEAG
ncbi:MAG: hypothetical protein AAGF12_28040 [Myxococcota bacterium]